MKKYRKQKVLWSFRKYDHKTFESLSALGFEVDLAFSTREIIRKLSQHNYALLLLETDYLLINSWLVLRYVEYFGPRDLHVILPSYSQNFKFASQHRRVIYQSVIPKGMSLTKLAWFLKRCDKKQRHPFLDFCCNH